MAHGVSEVLSDGSSVKMVHQKQQQSSVHPPQQQQAAAATRKSVGVMGSRRIFAPAFKLKVLDSYRNDIDCRGNQRATARKYGIHRRQIQKWLQCEDNLRISCAENGNAGVISSTLISSTGVSKPEGTVTEVTGPAVTPAAPALNLSLARLHGDELAAQQGPPPILPHPPHGSSPSSPQYGSQTNATSKSMASLRIAPLGYQEYSAQEQQQLRREAEDRVQVPDVHGYPETRLDQERSYYESSQHRELEVPPSSFDGRNEVKVYQTLTNYHLSRADPRYNEKEMPTGLHHHHHLLSPSHRPTKHEQSYGEVDSSADGKSYGALLAPSMIKTERASPDSAATPGPCESASSPVASRVPLSPLSQQTSSSSSSSISAHFDSPRATTSPCLHVHVHEHAHACTTSDSEKPTPCLHQQHQQQLERESRESTGYKREKGTENAMEEGDLGRAVVKEERHLKEEEEEEEEEANDEGGHGCSSSCTDYQRPPATSSLSGSRPVSPVHDREGYSLPSSPRGAAASERSSSSCSDSEMDPLDCSSGSHASSNDLARRRSFSLRFKLDVLDAFHRDVGVAGNQRATARKFGINRRQVQKWLGQETELRGEIALRGNTRQRLGPIQDATSGESPVDLRTASYVSSLSHDRIDAEYERSPPPIAECCDGVGSSSTQHLSYYHNTAAAALEPSTETEPMGPCNLSCCVDSHTTLSATSCYQELPARGSCYPEAQTRMYCYSPREYPEVISALPEDMSSPLKRQRCNLSCCYEPIPSPKRLCLENEEAMVAATLSGQDTPPQETPLCLVKPKRVFDASPCRVEPVTSTVPTPPASAAPPTPASKKDAILFKPYLDNPVSKPSKEHVIQRGLSPVSSQNVIMNNNNNCQSICNLNDGRGHDYALELSLRLPVSWRTHASPYTEFPQVRSPFVRYPTSPHYTYPVSDSSR